MPASRLRPNDERGSIRHSSCSDQLSVIYVDRILFPTDGSDCAELARRHAVHLADQFRAELHVLHVEEREVELADVVEIEEADVLSELHGALQGDDLPVARPRLEERTVAHPSAAGGILTYAVEHDVHLIVLGTHGRRGVQRLVLGSVTEDVVRRAPQPAVTVGRGAVAPNEMAGGRMLVPVDFSPHRKRLLAHAHEIALVYGMDVTLLHVLRSNGIPEAYDLELPGIGSGNLEEQVRNALWEDAEAFQEEGIGVAVKVEMGHAADRTLNVADAMGATFITIATHGRSGMQRMLLGSVSEKVIRQAPCPVCTVKSFGTSLVEEGA